VVVVCCVQKIEKSVVGNTKIGHVLLIDSSTIVNAIVTTTTIETI
jgi:hypothetical protein